MLNLNFLRSAAHAKTSPMASNNAATKILTLAKVPAGKQITIAGYDKLSPSFRQHLQAYGLLPGRTVQVLAQKPVTIVQVEQTELAFEVEIADQILVE
jgi:Fe2+ transport system protein FeoA